MREMGSVFFLLLFLRREEWERVEDFFFFLSFLHFFPFCIKTFLSNFHVFPAYFSASTPTASATLANPSRSSSSASRFLTLGTSAGPSNASAV
jgi:hypothetical protein